MTEELKNYIIKNKKLFMNNSFDEIYDNIPTELTSQLTETLMDSGIDFLPYLSTIPPHCFEWLTELTKVNMPRVTRIGCFAFADCIGLTDIVIPSSVISIGEYAFGRTVLESIVIPTKVTEIEEGTFYGCSRLTSVTIPNSVTNIGDAAFAYCKSLTSIVIPSSVTSIGNIAFNSCKSLTSIVIPSSVTSIGEGTLEGIGKKKLVLRVEKGSYADKFAKVNNYKVKYI